MIDSNAKLRSIQMPFCNHDFEPVNKADADRIAEEIETAEHIKKLRDMRSKSRGNHGIIQPHTR
ncbi:bacteriophage protein [Escherichia coli]|nr:bacteriophage protein [Escherichia coli]